LDRNALAAFSDDHMGEMAVDDVVSLRERTAEDLGDVRRLQQPSLHDLGSKTRCALIERSVLRTRRIDPLVPDLGAGLGLDGVVHVRRATIDEQLDRIREPLERTRDPFLAHQCDPGRVLLMHRRHR
jgi:hypothetical protein